MTRADSALAGAGKVARPSQKTGASFPSEKEKVRATLADELVVSCDACYPGVCFGHVAPPPQGEGTP